jgi:hypothetical protein
MPVRFPAARQARIGHEKISDRTQLKDRTSLMDAEHINLISNQIQDLSNRVNELRGYL